MEFTNFKDDFDSVIRVDRNLFRVRDIHGEECWLSNLISGMNADEPVPLPDVNIAAFRMVHTFLELYTTIRPARLPNVSSEQ